MPRSEIELPYRIEHLSILDEHGVLDTSLEPDISSELLLKLHWYMLLSRRYDERMLSLQRQGRIGTFAPIKGHEAVQLGAIAALRDTDWFVPQFREASAEFWRGRKLESILLFHNGYEEGIEIAPQQNDMPIGVIIAGQLPHAVGLAYGMKYRKTDQVVMTFFGDGGTSEGDFHEALNFATVFQLPVVFVCQNNQWAISVPRSRQAHCKTLAQRALAYDMPGLQVDGNDVLAMYAAATAAVERARSGGGPSLIEGVTYRVLMHSTADDPSRYRTEEEAAVWSRRDPLPRFQKYLVTKGLLSVETIAELEARAKQEIQVAIERFEQRMALHTDPLHMFQHHYAELTPTLEAQREELVLELENESAMESTHG
jgi:pyruvate dehydrogenase E1 component alpha subunit